MSNFAGPNIITDRLRVLLDANNTKSYPLSAPRWYNISQIYDMDFRLFERYINLYAQYPAVLKQNENNVRYFELSGISNTYGTVIYNAGLSNLEPFGMDSGTYGFFMSIPPSSNGAIFDNYRLPAIYGGINLRLSGENLSCRLTVSGLSAAFDTPRTPLNDGWALLNVIVDRNDNLLKLYCNNSMLCSVSISSFSARSINNALIGIGADFGIIQGFPTSRNFITNASIGVFYYYKKALSPMEIQTNYNALKTRYQV